MGLAPDVRPRRYTLAEYLALPEGTPGFLLGGEHVVVPAPNRAHQSVVGNLYLTLRVWADRRGAGVVYVAPFDVILDGQNVLQPDVLFVSKARMGILRERCYGAPDLVVEVLSQNKALDRGRKLEVYARSGVPHAWLIDPDEKTFECLALDGPSYRIARVFVSPEVAQPPGFDGLEIALEPFFALP